MSRRWIPSGLLLIALTACQVLSAPPGPATPIPIRLPMGYIANVQFAPFYVAVDKGYFAQEGIELSFDYSFETNGVQLVGAGQLPFAVVSGEQVPLARAQGLPVVMVAQWYQRYPIAVFALAERGIRTPQDLRGRKVGLPGFFGASYVGFKALLYASGLRDEEVEAVDLGGFTQVAAVKEGKVDAAVGYINNEPLVLRRAGLAVDVIDVADHAALVGNGIITNERTIRDQPDLVRRFLRAFLRGLRDTLRDPREAFEISKKYVEGLSGENEAAQWEVLQTTLPLWQAEVLGRSDLRAWQEMVAVLVRMGQLQEPGDVPRMFTNAFVEELWPQVERGR
ncbi:ABC transporter substrate-binding protein [Thermoflexus sp.]|uniref:ABC transporter substrate-binding protein n=1 Tax=Thermoflexus sp. TaxID=1969742 RepID=UPI0035E45918